MTYDEWKLETPEDEYDRIHRCKRRLCDDCGERWAVMQEEDLIGYGRDSWICNQCAEAILDRAERLDCEPDPPDREFPTAWND